MQAWFVYKHTYRRCISMHEALSGRDVAPTVILYTCNVQARHKASVYCVLRSDNESTAFCKQKTVFPAGALH